MRNSTKTIFTRSLSGFLALLTFVGLLASLSMLPVFAADEADTALSFDERYNKYYTDPSGDADFTSEQRRIDAMGDVYYQNENFELYVDDITGEVALKDKHTGDILFTNPFDVSEYPISKSDPNAKVIAQSYKQEILSQVLINYIENGTSKKYSSFKDAALLDQIKVKRLNGGVRVEYSIGEEESRTLVPRLISVPRFEEMILAQLEQNLPRNEKGEISSVYERLQAWYIKKDPEAIGVTNSMIQEMYTNYPITREFAVWVFSETAKKREIKLVESWIKSYCPKYTFEELDRDHRETGYTEKNIAPANFKMALEYYLTENGVEVRFPANGLTFDESNYELTSLEILQYMGAGHNYYEGYTFVPDGSGSITRFEDTIASSVTTQSGQVYGQDYSYQEVGSQNQQIFRLPVFGVVTDDKMQLGQSNNGVSETKQRATGYVAIITEGDALSKVTSIHGGKVYCYSSVYTSVNPRPKDTYNLGEAISVGGNAEYTVVSKRKYTGSFRINYIMLTDQDYVDDSANAEAIAAAKANGREFYDTTYMGMAKAYRDYLERKGDIQKITAARDDLPLYIEVFGLTQTDESVLSIPITVDKPLTSFEDLEKMVEELSTAQNPITNLNFRLRGFTNGGMVQTVPTKVKFEKVVGGNSGFRDFLDYAVEKGIGVYPDFDFAYMEDTALFDGFSYKRDAVKTIDNRYITKRVYDAVLQSFSRTDKICISPSVYRNFFEKFNASMTKVLDGRTTGISVATLGSDLNSDFDEDEPYNREDSKAFTAEMLGQIKNAYGNVMIDGGNAFAIPYASVVLNVPLDSSRFLTASQSVPFIGLVFHGYVELAGTPTNMAGDVKYEMLKIIENGAVPYMMFSYENVELLKEDPVLSQYYAIDYQIWKRTLLGIDYEGNYVGNGLYDRINTALKDVQTSRIEDHQFIDCTRQLTDKEIADITSDALAEYDTAIQGYITQLEFYQARLADYNRILATYPAEQAQEFLTWYGLNKEDLERQIKNYQNMVTFMEEKGLQDIIDRSVRNIDLKITDGSVVYVEYENGHWFVLNYNNYVVEVEINGQKITVEAKDFYDSKANA